jgi:uncharacterized protein
MNGYIVLGSAVVGLLVGLTGAGGGALMTPMLILVFSVKPSAAIVSDLVAAVVMRPVGAAVHFQRRTVNLGLVAWMSAGSVPAAFAGAYVLHVLGQSKAAAGDIQIFLGAALLVGAGAMFLRRLLDDRAGHQRRGVVRQVTVRPLPTVAIGVLGGLVVGMTSVGAGSLMIVLLMFCYPTLAANQLVGTDLTQAIPLTASAALGALAFSHVQLPLTTSIVVGSVPAVLVGSLLSSRVSDRHLRPAIMIVVLASGLKYVGLDNAQLAWTLSIFLAVVGLNSLLRAQPWRSAALPRRTTPGRAALPNPAYLPDEM